MNHSDEKWFTGIHVEYPGASQFLTNTYELGQFVKVGEILDCTISALISICTRACDEKNDIVSLLIEVDSLFEKPLLCTLPAALHNMAVQQLDRVISYDNKKMFIGLFMSESNTREVVMGCHRLSLAYSNDTEPNYNTTEIDDIVHMFAESVNTCEDVSDYDDNGAGEETFDYEHKF